MTRFLNWRSANRGDLDSLESLDARLGVLEFVEHLMHQQVGYLTPRELPLCSGLFRFSLWVRNERGSLEQSQAPRPLLCQVQNFGDQPRARLPEGHIGGLGKVRDGWLSAQDGARLPAGSSRLCIQSSTRYDDILNTPLAACEWLRKPGEKEVIGLRSRATAGKDRSTLVGCFPERCLRGEWQLAAHADVLGIGKSRGHLAFRRSLRQIAVWQWVSSRRLPGSKKTWSLWRVHWGNSCQRRSTWGLTAEGVEVLRWHGAKASLSSLMQHLNLPKRVGPMAGQLVLTDRDPCRTPTWGESQVLILRLPGEVSGVPPSGGGTLSVW